MGYWNAVDCEIPHDESDDESDGESDDCDNSLVAGLCGLHL